LPKEGKGERKLKDLPRERFARALCEKRKREKRKKKDDFIGVGITPKVIESPQSVSRVAGRYGVGGKKKAGHEKKGKSSRTVDFSHGFQQAWLEKPPKLVEGGEKK